MDNLQNAMEKARQNSNEPEASEELKKICAENGFQPTMDWLQRVVNSDAEDDQNLLAEVENFEEYNSILPDDSISHAAGPSTTRNIPEASVRMSTSEVLPVEQSHYSLNSTNRLPATSGMSDRVDGSICYFR